MGVEVGQEPWPKSLLPWGLALAEVFSRSALGSRWEVH